MVTIPARTALALLDLTARTARGTTFTFTDAAVHTGAPELAAWCRDAGHRLVAVTGSTATIRRGPLPDPFAGLAPHQIPGARVWIYTNFDCNLACDYCCTRSSPSAPRRALDPDRIARIAKEAAAADVGELLLTGGEPFLLPDLDELVAACTDALPTTLLTNGTLLRGERLARLRRMDRERLTLQISLDSPTPARHERHRGRRSWDRAVEGIHTALSDGFRVRVAATVGGADFAEDDYRRFLDALPIPREDQVIRRVAAQGFAINGLALRPDTLVPEVVVTADGVWWHPVAVTDPAHFVTAEIFPLADAIDLVRERFRAHRATADAAAAWFPCA